MNKLEKCEIRLEQYDKVNLRREHIRAMNQINKGNLEILDILKVIDVAEFVERAAILEYYNGMERRAATKQALIELFEIYDNKVVK